MRIGFDLRTLQGHSRYRGIGRNVSSILKEMSKIDNRNHYVFYLFKNIDNPLKDLDIDKRLKYEVEYVEESNLPKKRLIGILFREFREVDVANDNLDVFYQPDVSYGIPRGVRSVLVFYDLIPLYFWHKNKFRRNLILYYKDELISRLFRRRYLATIRNIKKADRIISISGFSKNDLIKNFPDIKSKNVSVVYLASSDVFNNRKPQKEHSDEDFLLYVGGADQRKNINGLIKIFYKLKENNYNLKLVLVGKEFNVQKELRHYPWFFEIKDNKYYKDIIFKEYVDDAELIGLYKNAKVFMFASKYEGFGLPIIEAMSIGTPVVAFNNSSIPEVAGDSAILCNNNKEFEEAVEKLLKNNDLRKTIINKGYLQAKKFNWPRTAKETLAIIEEEGGK